MLDTHLPEVKKYDYIDALRGIAVLGTLLIHCSHFGINQFPVFVNEFILAGGYGVQLFYVMSALTLYMSMNKRNALEKSPTINFFIRRFFRIAPLFYLMVIIYFIINKEDARFYSSVADGNIVGFLISTFTFTNAFHPYWINSIVPGGWSIAIEMVFYAILPVLFLFVRSLKRALILLVTLLCLYLVGNYIFSTYLSFENNALKSTFLYINFIAQVPLFAFGIILYYILEKGEKHGIFWPFMVLLLFLALHIIYQIFPPHIVFGIFFFFVAFLLAQKPAKLFVNGITIFIGKLSFSIYLVHHLILIALEKTNMVNYTGMQISDFVIRYLITVLISTGVSYILYKLIEVPGQNLGKRIIKYLENR